MFEIKQHEEILKNEMVKLKNEIKLMVFTDVKTLEDGTKQRFCMSCDATINLLETLSTFSGDKLKIEEYSINNSRDQCS